MRVKGTIDGAPFRSSLMPAGDGDVFVVVNKELREKIGKGNGEVVEMTVGRDTSVVDSIPADLKKALSQNAKAETYFRKMAPSHRKAYVQWIEQAKKAETRESRLKKAIHMHALARKDSELNTTKAEVELWEYIHREWR